MPGGLFSQKPMTLSCNHPGVKLLPDQNTSERLVDRLKVLLPPVLQCGVVGRGPSGVGRVWGGGHVGRPLLGRVGSRSPQATDDEQILATLHKILLRYDNCNAL